MGERATSNGRSRVKPGRIFGNRTPASRRAKRGKADRKLPPPLVQSPDPVEQPDGVRVMARPVGPAYLSFWADVLGRPGHPPRVVDLARAVGVHPTTVTSYFSRGKKPPMEPSLLSAYRLARAIGCTVEQLVQGVYLPVDAARIAKRAKAARGR